MILVNSANGLFFLVNILFLWMINRLHKPFKFSNIAIFTNSKMIRSYAITVSGKVQGVFFRKFTKEKAIELGLNGFVRNQNDGSVYIEATGEENVLDPFIQWCHDGSPLSVVKDVTVKEISTKHQQSFRIQYF